VRAEEESSAPKMRWGYIIVAIKWCETTYYILESIGGNMAKYAITYVDERGVEMRKTMIEKSKDDVIQSLLWMLAEAHGEDDGVRVTYPDGSYYAAGALDPDRYGGPVEVTPYDEWMAELRIRQSELRAE